jgi:hypothetical protein
MSLGQLRKTVRGLASTGPKSISIAKALPKVYGDRQSVEGKLILDYPQVCQEAAADKWSKRTEAERQREVAEAMKLNPCYSGWPSRIGPFKGRELNV